MVLTPILKLIDEAAFPIRRKNLAKILAPYLTDSKKVLDIGTSEGSLAKKLIEMTMVNIVGVDRIIQPKSQIKVYKYNGRKLSFGDNSFDMVMFIDVLHHDKNPEKILLEAARVSKKYILIKDHFWKNKIDFQILKIADYIGNKPYGIDLPYNYLTIDSWHKLFAKCRLKIKEEKILKIVHPIDPTKHIIFKLEVNKN